MNEIPPEFPRFAPEPSPLPSPERIAAASRAVRRRRLAKATVGAAIACTAVAAVVVPAVALSGNRRADRLDVVPASPSPAELQTASPTPTVSATGSASPTVLPSVAGVTSNASPSTASPTPTAARIIVGVVTTSTGATVPNASVVDWDTGQITHTDSGGTFTVPCHDQQILVAPNLPTDTDGYFPHPGPRLHNGPEPGAPVPGYRFVGGGDIPYVSDHGPTDQAHPVKCVNEAITHVRVTLPDPIVVTVHLEHADGTPAAGYRFGLIESNHVWASYDVTADNSGSATFYGLAPGAWGLLDTFQCDANSTNGGSLSAGDRTEWTCRQDAPSPTPTHDPTPTAAPS